MTTLYTNARHRRLLVLIYAMSIALLISVTVTIHGYYDGDDEKLQLGLILSVFFLIALGGLEFFMGRYVYALEKVPSGVIVITGGVRGKRSVGKLHSIGAEVRERSDGLHNRYHKVTAGSPRKTYILDVTADPDLVLKLRRLI